MEKVNILGDIVIIGDATNMKFILHKSLETKIVKKSTILLHHSILFFLLLFLPFDLWNCTAASRHFFWRSSASPLAI